MVSNLAPAFTGGHKGMEAGGGREIITLVSKQLYNTAQSASAAALQ